jgi:two-component system nitrate/nitrite response regulator NarL
MSSRTTGSRTAVRVLVVDRHPIVRYGLCRLLERELDFLLVGEAADGRDAVRLVDELKPDVLLLELAPPQFSGLDTVRELVAARRPVGIVVMATSDEQLDIAGALQLGVRGVLWKNTALELIPTSIRRVMAGERWIGRRVVSDLAAVLRGLVTESLDTHGLAKPFGLTAREEEILAAIVAGASNKRVGQRLGVSEDTVKHHLTRMFDKLGVANRLELALVAIHRRLLIDRQDVSGDRAGSPQSAPADSLSVEA